MAKKITRAQFITRQMRRGRSQAQAETSWKMMGAQKEAMSEYYLLNARTYTRPNPGMMTYGQLPPEKDVLEAIDDEPYHMTLRGRADTEAADGTVFERAIERDAVFDPDEMWEGLTELVAKWDAGSDEAGDLASSILTTLDFEWV